ncbi:hypothetical protein Zm00014a_040934 [Zea mays]|uniref:Uncharacterized protein n=1 Tax=Zea mays TaxID=4577 RepID=A0A3L6EAT6_MAIZE|nr:hypothetical protein Zm00014a_040934 [Zea mays]
MQPTPPQSARLRKPRRDANHVSRVPVVARGRVVEPNHQVLGVDERAVLLRQQDAAVADHGARRVRSGASPSPPLAPAAYRSMGRLMRSMSSVITYGSNCCLPS